MSVLWGILLSDDDDSNQKHHVTVYLFIFNVLWYLRVGNMVIMVFDNIYRCL